MEPDVQRPGYAAAVDAPAEHDNNQVSTSKIWQVITSSSVGTVIEWYDFYIFGSLATIIATLYFPKDNPVAALLSTLAAFAVGFVVRPFGAVVFGRIGDMVGRKYTFLLTLLLMGGSTFAIGLVPTFATIGVMAPVLLFLLRVVQGLALGGEYGGAATYVAEHSPDSQRGYYTSFIQTTATIGLFVSIAVLIGTRLAVGDEAFKIWGWRIPFLLSGVLVIASYYIRRRLNESPLFEKAKAEGTTSKSPLRDSFVEPENRKLVLLALFGATMGQGVVWYTGQFYAYFFLQTTLKIEQIPASIILCVALLLATPFFIYFGSLSDRIGRKRIIMTGLLCGAVFTVPIFYGLHAFCRTAGRENRRHRRCHRCGRARRDGSQRPQLPGPHRADFLPRAVRDDGLRPDCCLPRRTIPDQGALHLPVGALPHRQRRVWRLRAVGGLLDSHLGRRPGRGYIL